MKFGTNPPPSSVPDDWTDRVNPFLPADSPSQPVWLDDGTLAPPATPPCTKPCCQGDS